MNEILKGVIIWAVFLSVCAALLAWGRRLRKQIDENGIEADAAVSRIDVSFDSETHTHKVSFYARYRTQDGEEIEGLLLDPPSNLQEGQRIRVKYHPKLTVNAKVLGMESAGESSEFRIL